MAGQRSSLHSSAGASCDLPRLAALTAACRLACGLGRFRGGSRRDVRSQRCALKSRKHLNRARGVLGLRYRRLPQRLLKYAWIQRQAMACLLMLRRNGRSVPKNHQCPGSLHVIAPSAARAGNLLATSRDENCQPLFEPGQQRQWRQQRGSAMRVGVLTKSQPPTWQSQTTLANAMNAINGHWACTNCGSKGNSFSMELGKVGSRQLPCQGVRAWSDSEEL